MKRIYEEDNFINQTLCESNFGVFERRECEWILTIRTTDGKLSSFSSFISDFYYFENPVNVLQFVKECCDECLLSYPGEEQAYINMFVYNAIKDILIPAI